MCLPVAVIVELIVRRQRDEAAPSSRQGEEDLSSSVFPHLRERGAAAGEGQELEGLFSVCTLVFVEFSEEILVTFASFSFSHFGVIK